MTSEEAKPDSDGPSDSQLLAYLRLFRLPNVFTAIADIAMGFLFVAAAHDPEAYPQWDVFACLVLASCCLYTAGMVLNDVYDYDIDARERPERPLPSGQIPLGKARWLGYLLLAMGVGLAWLAGFLIEPFNVIGLAWRSGVVGSLLAICIVLYDAVLKRTVFGPLAMGACRFLNVLLGMSVGAAFIADQTWWRLGYDTCELAVAGGIGIYIVGVTWFARKEAGASRRFELLLAIGMMLAGIFVLGMYPGLGNGGARMDPVFQQKSFLWPALLLLLSFTLVRRCMTAALDPHPKRVQLSVKLAIMSLIMFDAAVTFSVAGLLGIAVLALLAPMLILGRWVYST